MRCYVSGITQSASPPTDISTLEIVTRPAGSSASFCKLFRAAKTIACGLSAIPRDECGTTITAHDLFYNMPVCATVQYGGML
jgi:DNA mismatch repair ATPase MutL